MNTFRADLHCHSTCSDGSKTPEQIIQLAKESGLSALSITDHDSIDAYTTAVEYAKKEGITLLPGVEFSATLEGHSVHILGYGFSLDSRSIADLCTRHADRREKRNGAMLKSLSEHGMPLTNDELIAALPPGLQHTIGRPHIALAMMKKGYVTSIQEAFNKYLGEEKLCYVQGIEIGVDETIAAIHQGKGIAVLAHPHLIKNEQLTRKLLKEPFDGLECYYGKFYHDAHQHWLKLAKKHDLLITGGSDYHGDIKPNLNLGCSWINAELFQAIQDKITLLNT
ncbi:MAG: PHP domain-containing protein [Parachlamydiaceae bacterium]